MDKAIIYFERSKDFDYQSLYMLSVMLYDGLGCKSDTVSTGLGPNIIACCVLLKNSPAILPLDKAFCDNSG